MREKQSRDTSLTALFVGEELSDGGCFHPSQQRFNRVFSTRFRGNRKL